MRYRVTYLAQAVQEGLSLPDASAVCNAINRFPEVVFWIVRRHASDT
jgi:hypothetical protein